jgi:hypothetical protein
MSPSFAQGLQFTPPTSLAESWLHIATGLGALGVFIAGLIQYYRAQRWQRAQTLSEELTRFQSDLFVNKALSMLDDYEERDLELFPGHEDPARRMVKVTTEMVIQALFEADAYGTEDARRCDAIRDCFDRFFDGLERFVMFMEAKLMRTEEVQPHLAYWIQQLADPKESRKGKAFVAAATHYIKKFYFGEVERLCRRMGYPV